MPPATAAPATTKIAISLPEPAEAELPGPAAAFDCVNDSGGRRAGVRGRDLDLVLALAGIRLQAAGHGAALRIRGDRERVRATGKFRAGSTGGRFEQDERARHWPVVVVLHFDNRLTRGALADIVDGAVAFHDHQVELGDGRLGRRAGGTARRSIRREAKTGYASQPSEALIMAGSTAKLKRKGLTIGAAEHHSDRWACWTAR